MLRLSTVESIWDKEPKPALYESFSSFAGAIKTHLITQNKSNVKLFVPCTFTGEGGRTDALFGSSQLIPIDVDQKNESENPHTEVTARILLEHFGLEGVVYTSHSHSIEKPRLRMIIPTSRPMKNITEFRTVVHYISTLLFGQTAFDDLTLDLKALTPSQPYYLPSCPEDGKKYAKFTYDAGDPADVDWIIENYVEPHDTSAAACALSEVRPAVVRDGKGLISQRLERHQRVDRVLCRAFSDGLTVEAAAIAALTFDIKYHHKENGVSSGPHFTDPDYTKPGGRYSRMSPEAAAMKRARSEYMLLSRKMGDRSSSFVERSAAASAVPSSGEVPHGAEVIGLLKSVSDSKSAAGEPLKILCFSLYGSRRMIWHKLPENEVAASIVSRMREISGVEPGPNESDWDASGMVGLEFGIRVKTRPATDTRKADSEVGAFLSIKESDRAKIKAPF